MFKFFKKNDTTEPEIDAKVEETINKELVYNALSVLTEVDAKGKKATKADLTIAIQEAIGYLSQITV